MQRLALTAIPAALLTLTLTSVGAASGYSSRMPARCSTRSSHLVVADTQAQVYAVATKQGLAYHGCAYGRRATFELGDRLYCARVGCAGISLVTLAGPIVAYESQLTTTGFSEEDAERNWYIVVRDLRTGKVLRKTPAGTYSPRQPEIIGDGEAEAIVLKSDGAVAWIVNTFEDTNTYQVHALDRTGFRVLAESSAIDPSSLALAGSTLYWMQEGKPMSATLD